MAAQMFRLEKNNDFISLHSPCSSTQARFCLGRGGSLDTLVVENTNIVTNLSPISPQKTYPSSVLFPFANRIKDGKYSFNNKNYAFDCNEAAANNALHGLVYNKTFNCVAHKLTPEFASLQLRYGTDKPEDSFPFFYRIDLFYKLTKNGLSLAITVLNTGENKFPFTLGWHPYFKTSDINQSALRFSSSKKLAADARNITTGVVGCDLTIPYGLKGVTLDDAYILQAPVVEFITPEYDLKLTASEAETYLQLYTPPAVHAIAIEPMTGVSNSFNNKIGLKELHPKETFQIFWDLEVQLKIIETESH
jgi:aldose 1-epimerase